MPNKLSRITPMRFECAVCGRCCTSITEGDTISLYEDDIFRIATFLGMPIEVYITKFTKVYQYEFRYGGSSTFQKRIVLPTETGCPHLSGKQCSIHPVMPFQCKASPFIIQFSESRAALERFLSICKGIARGSKVSVASAISRLNEHKALEAAFIDSIADPKSFIHKLLQLKSVTKTFVVDYDFTVNNSVISLLFKSLKGGK